MCHGPGTVVRSETRSMSAFTSTWLEVGSLVSRCRRQAIWPVGFQRLLFSSPILLQESWDHRCGTAPGFYVGSRDRTQILTVPLSTLYHRTVSKLPLPLLQNSVLLCSPSRTQTWNLSASASRGGIKGVSHHTAQCVFPRKADPTIPSGSGCRN